MSLSKTLYPLLSTGPTQEDRPDIAEEGGEHLCKTFSISYLLNSENSVLTDILLIGICPMRKILLRIIRDLNLLSFFMEKCHFL